MVRTHLSLPTCLVSSIGIEHVATDDKVESSSLSRDANNAVSSDDGDRLISDSSAGLTPRAATITWPGNLYGRVSD